MITFFTNCVSNQPRPLTEREMIFEKGRALLLAHDYDKAQDLFLSLTGQHMPDPDVIYDQSIWNLAVIYEKNFPEKTILLLSQLSNSNYVSSFKVNALLMKTYFRVDNPKQALKYKKALDSVNPKIHLSASTLYYDLLETLDLNYDHLLLQELQYVSEIQKYLIFIMEQNDSAKNEKVTELLTAIYEKTYALLEKDTVSAPFKQQIAVALLNNLRRFDILKINDLNVNMKTIAKFSVYSEQKQKQITDWLHQ